MRFRGTLRAVQEDTRAFRFWQRWLVVACIATGLFGLVLAISDTRLVPLFPEALAQSLWGSDAMPAGVVGYHRFVHGVVGGTIAGWSVLLAAVAIGPFRARERWAWTALAGSIGTWFIVDGAASIAFGVWPNVVLNVGSLVALATPLAMTRRHFAGPP